MRKISFCSGLQLGSEDGRNSVPPELVGEGETADASKMLIGSEDVGTADGKADGKADG